jgi:phage tail-like protein
MITTSQYYPPVGFSFKVNVEGIMGVNEGSFQEVSGLSVKITPKNVEEGGENRFIHRFPTPPNYENLILKRGMLILTFSIKQEHQFPPGCSLMHIL